MINFFRGILILLLFPSILIAQKNSSADILHRIEKLKVLGSVLYIAAHPDDENTGMITYFSNERKMKTTYLSLTRGDGGQNLIGPEKYQWMGLIRTQELLEARKIDGGEQAFSRAYDFGYSKTPEETLKIWNEDSILADVVWVIRKLRPDIIITRFSPDLGRRTHGHHTSSAILGLKGFEIAGDKNSFPDQLGLAEPWQPERIFFNTSWWFYGSRDFDKTGLLQIETGQYNPLMGMSYGEVAAKSRSMHKSQGFGVIGERGSDLEYLKPLGGSEVSKDPLEGIDITWSRVNGGEKIQARIDQVLERFNSRHPEESVAGLLEVRSMIQNVEDEFWRNQKLKEVEALINDCLGIFAESLCSKVELVPGEKMPTRFTLIQRLGDQLIKIKKIQSKKLGYEKTIDQDLTLNQISEWTDTIDLPEDLDFTVPYWLAKPLAKGRFNVENKALIGLPENDFEVPFEFTLELDGSEWELRVPTINKTRDRVKGEVRKEVVIVPAVVARFADKNVLFPSSEGKKVQVIVKSYKSQENGLVKLDLPNGWKSDPKSYSGLLVEGEEKRIEFFITPPKKAGRAKVDILSGNEEQTLGLGQIQIEHEHIKPLTAVVPNSIDFIREDIRNSAKIVGYVDGAGDEIPQALAQLGSSVKYLDEEDFFNGGLRDLDAIVFGVRAYNTTDWLPNVREKIMEFVEGGGNVVVQYNVSYGLVTEDIGPYPLKISRDRVTDEDSKVEIIDPDNPILLGPNRITGLDFEGWVQERGLYFPNEWDGRYSPLISCSDPGEEELKGAILTTKYGKGSFTYTGISWFRQLPAGVGGAYKLFANLISADKGT